MAGPPVGEPHERLSNLLAALALGLVDDGTAAMRVATGLSNSGVAALVALSEFLDGQNVGRLADVLGISHSGAVRLVAHLELEGLVRRTHREDARQVNVVLTAKGRRQARRAARARMDVVATALAKLSEHDSRRLERVVAHVLEGLVTQRLRRREEEGERGAWLCRMCDFEACGRPAGRCPAAETARSL
jgi:DNA-binding MarR family transcriptional regulator